jgi:riboflavin synthase
MFTGIVSGVGTLRERQGGRFTIASPYKRSSLTEGASIACDGCCLTIVEVSKAKNGSEFSVDVSNETLSRTTLGEWQEALGEELGGHLVAGHIDGRAKVLARHTDGDSVRFILGSPPMLARFIATKGSIALDGVSLTVNEVEGNRFGVNVIPYTLRRTTWGDRVPGDLVNLEVDLMSRYAARLSESQGETL